MAFDKIYPNRKDWRKQYKGAKRFDRTCRCHGSCPYCTSERLFFDRKKRKAADEELARYQKYIDGEPVIVEKDKPKYLFNSFSDTYTLDDPDNFLDWYYDYDEDEYEYEDEYFWRMTS